MPEAPLVTPSRLGCDMVVHRRTLDNRLGATPWVRHHLEVFAQSAAPLLKSECTDSACSTHPRAAGTSRRSEPLAFARRWSTAAVWVL
jgi:hypothetical protein